MSGEPRRVLFCTTLDNQILHFHVPYIRMLREQGCQVDVASAGTTSMPFCDNKIDLPFTKQPISIANLRAFRRLRRILREQQYDLLHCHSPSAGAIARLAARSLPRKRRPVVFYTAHGFHFFHGAPRSYWMLIYPLEKLLARWTDCLLVMNREDRETVERYKFRRDASSRCREWGWISPGSTRLVTRAAGRPPCGARVRDRRVSVVLCGGIVRPQKPAHAAGCAGTPHLKDPRVRLILAGRDLLDGALQREAVERGLAERVDFVGHREDIPEWLLLTDMVVASSRQEGLPVNLIEAMACGRPVVATAVRGHVDLIDHEINGLLVPPGDVDTMAEAVESLSEQGSRGGDGRSGGGGCASVQFERGAAPGLPAL
jgi:glycosyltransferase EpsD